MKEGGEKIKNNITRNQSFVVDNLKPGTSYRFEIFPRGPDGTEGPPRTVDAITGKYPDPGFLPETSIVYRCLVFQIYFSLYEKES